jgi:hypothetical protein
MLFDVADHDATYVEQIRSRAQVAIDAEPHRAEAQQNDPERSGGAVGFRVAPCAAPRAITTCNGIASIASALAGATSSENGIPACSSA